MTLIIEWRQTSAYAAIGEPGPETCSEYGSFVMGEVSSTFVELTLGDRQVSACLARGVINNSLHGNIPLAADGSDREGFVRFRLNFSDSSATGVPEAGRSVLESLQVNFR